MTIGEWPTADLTNHLMPIRRLEIACKRDVRGRLLSSFAVQLPAEEVMAQTGRVSYACKQTLYITRWHHRSVQPLCRPDGVDIRMEWGVVGNNKDFGVKSQFLLV